MCIPPKSCPATLPLKNDLGFAAGVWKRHYITRVDSKKSPYTNKSDGTRGLLSRVKRKINLGIGSFPGDKNSGVFAKNSGGFPFTV